MGCGARFEPRTDESFRKRDIAAPRLREGRPFNAMSLAPRASTNTIRQCGRASAGEDRLQQSVGANLAKTVRSLGKKARENTRGRRMIDLMSDRVRPPMGLLQSCKVWALYYEVFHVNSLVSTMHG